MKKLLYLFISICFLATLYYFNNKDDITFDSDKWKNWVEQEDNFNLRKYMMNSLESNYDLIGMSKQEVIELFGESPSRYNENFNYFIGYGRGINTCSLYIIFDDNKIVKGYEFHEG